MNSKEIKTFLRVCQRITAPVSVTTNATLNPYINARIRPTKASCESSFRGPLEFPAEFSVAFRQCCLAAVYGADSSLAKQSAGGNIGAHSIAMKAHEWRLAASLFSRC